MGCYFLKYCKQIQLLYRVHRKRQLRQRLKLISFYTFLIIINFINNMHNRLKIALFNQFYRSFVSKNFQSMFLYNRNNNVRDNDRGRSVGCNLFGFNQVRSFQPKFMDFLNKPVIQQSTLNKYKYPSQIKPQQSKYNASSRITEKKVSKQNIGSSYSNFKQVRSEITFKKQLQPKICKIRGLNNIGNTCYMNSILQCLLNLAKFNTYLINEVNEYRNSKFQVAIQYKNVVQEFLQTYGSSSFIPSKLKNSIGRKKCRFLGSAQQDAQQFLTAFLQLVNEQMSRIKQKPKYMELQNDPNKRSIKSLSQQWWDYYKKRDDSVICDFFQGQLISTVTCKKCKNQSVTFDNIWGLPLSLSKTTYSISEIIKNNWNVQNQITDYYCGVCKKSRDCTKRLQFFKLPQILVIQFKRFEYGKWRKEKIKTSVKLSDTLSLAQCLHKNAQNQNHMYKLSGIVHHYGQVDYGHYTASTYKQKQKRWYLLNDSKTSESTPQSPSNTVYLAFYQRVSK